MVEHVVDQILAEGSTKRGYLGVTTQPAELSGSLRSTLGIEQEYGLLIINVGDGSPAEQSGILQGDIVLAIEGKGVDSPDRMRRRLRKFNSGQTITITLVRGGQKTDISATLGESAE
jgi:S1-C subfamily serine protease